MNRRKTNVITFQVAFRRTLLRIERLVESLSELSPSFRGEKNLPNHYMPASRRGEWDPQVDCLGLILFKKYEGVAAWRAGPGDDDHDSSNFGTKCEEQFFKGRNECRKAWQRTPHGMKQQKIN